MKLKVLVTTLVFSSIAAPSLNCNVLAAEPDQGQSELFKIAERLESLRPLTVEGIEKITGHTVRRNSIASLASAEQYDSKLLRSVEVFIDPRESLVTGTSLNVAKSLVIGREQIVGKFGKATKRKGREVFDRDALNRFGYRTLVWYEYKRKDGSWLSFAFDDDKSRQLRIMAVTSPDHR